MYEMFLKIKKKKKAETRKRWRQEKYKRREKPNRFESYQKSSRLGTF